MVKRNHQPENDRNPHQLMTVHEVAKQLRVDDTTIRKWIRAGILEAIVLPHKGKRQGYRIKRAVFEKLLETQEGTTPANIR
jgi:excisionase family DNA binding protein